MKLSKYLKLRKECNKLSDKIEEYRPEKKILLFFSHEWQPEIRMKRFWTIQDAIDYKQNLIGPSDPNRFKFYICKEINEKTNSN